MLARLVLPVTLPFPVHLDSLFPRETVQAEAEQTATAGTADSAAYSIETNSADSASEGLSKDIVSDTSSADTETEADALAFFETAMRLLQSIDIWTYLFIAWAGGALAFLGKTLVRGRRFSRKVGRSLKEAPKLCALLQENKERLGLKGDIRIACCDGIDIPITYGMLHSTILLPSTLLDTFSDTKLKGILLHELCHIRRRDILKSTIWCIAKAVHWFNPLVWAAYQKYLDDVEVACDTMVTRYLDTSEKRVYLQSLLDVLRLTGKKMQAPLTMLFAKRKSELGRRVEAMIKPVKRSNKRTAAAMVLALMMSIACFTTACQPTPEEEAVQNKEGDGQEQIYETASSEGEDLSGQHFVYEKQYEDGPLLKLDCEILQAQSKNIPVLSIALKEFKADESIQKIAEAFAEGEHIYKSQGLTKQQLEKIILEYQEERYRVEERLPVEEDDPTSIVPESERAQRLANLDALLSYCEEQYQTVPDFAYIEPDYQFEQDEIAGTYHAAMYYESDGETISVSFSNSEPVYLGSSFIYNATPPWFEGGEGFPANLYALYQKPETLEGDERFEEAREVADEAVAKLGTDYLILDLVREDEEGYYTLVYTRQYGSLHENYVEIHLGSSIFADGAEVIDLWDPEYCSVRVAEGELVSLSWNNPSVITAVENENVAVLPWEEIEEIFKKQMDYLLTASDSSVFFRLAEEVSITRIEFGLVKLLKKDSTDEYQLVPAWNFFGVSDNWQIENCFLTINAIDGSVIDRGLMY